MVEDGVTRSYFYDQDHRLTSYSKPPAYSVSFTCDANRNAITRSVTGGANWAYAYDAEDRITEVTQNGVPVGLYVYDGLGRRVSVVEGLSRTYFAYPGLSLVYTENIQPAPGSPMLQQDVVSITMYLYACGLLVARIVDGTTTDVHQDHLGSLRAITNSAGTTVYSTHYKPFGLEYGTTGTDPKLKFTGQQKDANTGLYYLFRRFYDPDVGRFLSQDPVLGHHTAPQSLDRYVYTVNNPLRYVDPTGEDWVNPWDALAAGVSRAGDAAANW